MGAVTLLALLCSVFVQRLVYPLELEWMEGGTVTEIQVILAGRPLYAEPRLEFTPFLYPPFFFYLSAFVARIVGVGLLAPRLVSISATIGTMFLAARLVRAEGGRPLAVLVALSFVAISFQRCGFFMDLARVDSLFVFIGLLAFYMLRMGHTTWSAVLAGGLFTLSFFTKQTGLLLSVAVLAGALFWSRKRAMIAGATTAITLPAAYLLMNRATDGWFGYYAFTVAGAHALRWHEWWLYLRVCFWEPLPICLLFGLAAFVSGAFRERRAWMYGALCSSSLAAGYASIMKTNGFINSIMPWLVYLAIVGGIGVESVLRALEKQPRWRRFGLSLIILQWVVVLYSPRTQLPKRRDRAAGMAFVENLRDRPGPILAFNAGYLVAMAGRPEISAHTMALVDIFEQKDPARTAKLSADIEAALTSGHYATIITDDTTDWLPGVMALVRQHYREEPAMDATLEPWTKTGTSTRPKSLWTRRP